ncbi:LysR family transcriptional regulator [Pseudooceanicola sp. CBS1P-1]|uniref:LysR family transcriptional regulator n=1 Tax=Pseudooceanicola albus TaxID=2692189 RepID=A0A6L7G4C2_9RHOB|nr:MULTISPECIES: LysR substrate-binding domain-containing protein [Pseudooceanicola]MBT9384574.1 LysR family transcriptional regulator [Pseudooceanicola endophyticus]MXN18276.1 LysR family transcriptional regulator [Pseudooceanicola albus]
MTERLPSLNALCAFEATARLGSMALAAEELCVTPGAVSQQIRTLERDLGSALFIRRPRQITLTETGAALFPAARSAFRILREASAAARARPGGRVVTLGCTADFAAHWLLPRLPRFERRHPEVDLRLSTSNRVMPFGAEGLDLSVRHGLGRWPGLRAERLLDDALVAVCSPAYLAARGPFTTASLARATFLHDEHRYDWPLWLEAAGLSGPQAPAGPLFRDSGTIEAALAGHGLALLRRSLIAPLLEEGRLVAPFPQGLASDLAYYLVAPGDLPTHGPVAALHAWLREEAGR